MNWDLAIQITSYVISWMKSHLVNMWNYHDDDDLEVRNVSNGIFVSMNFRLLEISQIMLFFDFHVNSKQRTNNFSERCNKRFNALFPTPHPPLATFVEALKTESESWVAKWKV